MCAFLFWFFKACDRAQEKPGTSQVCPVLTSQLCWSLARTRLRSRVRSSFFRLVFVFSAGGRGGRCTPSVCGPSVSSCVSRILLGGCGLVSSSFCSCFWVRVLAGLLLACLPRLVLSFRLVVFLCCSCTCVPCTCLVCSQFLALFLGIALVEGFFFYRARPVTCARHRAGGFPHSSLCQVF